MVSQTEFTLRPRTRGFHLITDEYYVAPVFTTTYTVIAYSNPPVPASG